MKNFVFAAMIAAGIFASASADASVCNMSNCSYAITSDSSVSLGCAYTSYMCSCVDIATNNGVPYRIQSTNPGPQWVNYGNVINSANKCWIGDYLVAADEKIETSKASLADVFTPDQSTTYYGYVSTTNRSPNNGRTISATARLDVCLGATDTDTALSGGSVSSCQQYCGSTNYNDYCSANGAAVCNDRCECALSDPNCSNL